MRLESGRIRGFGAADRPTDFADEDPSRWERSEFPGWRIDGSLSQASYGAVRASGDVDGQFVRAEHCGSSSAGEVGDGSVATFHHGQDQGARAPAGERTGNDCRHCELRSRCITYGWMSPGGLWFENTVVLRPLAGCRGWIGHGADILGHFEEPESDATKDRPPR